MLQTQHVLHDILSHYRHYQRVTYTLSNLNTDLLVKCKTDVYLFLALIDFFRLHINFLTH